MDILNSFVVLFSKMNCLAQLMFVSLITIIIIQLIRFVYKPTNHFIFEWLSAIVSFIILLIIDLIIIFNFTHRLDTAVILQEILLIIGTPFFTKLFYDTIKTFIKSLKEQIFKQQETTQN